MCRFVTITPKMHDSGGGLGLAEVDVSFRRAMRYELSRVDHLSTFVRPNQANPDVSDRRLIRMGAFAQATCVLRICASFAWPACLSYPAGDSPTKSITPILPLSRLYT